MKKPLVSIIIPFYNEEKYLDRAINSAINQSYKNIEIILVDDGSVDASKDIAKQFALNNKNVFLITNSKNQSLGFSRNKGVDLAKGKYITFLDADDELDDKMLTICVQTIMNDNSDIVVVKYSLFNERKELVKILGWFGIPKSINYLECIKALYSNKLSPTAWGKLYRLSIVKTVKFPEEVWFEDYPFLLEMLLNCKKISLIEDNLLRIHSRKESITRRTLSEKRIIDTKKIFVLELQLLTDYNKIRDDKKNIEAMIYKNHLMSMLDNFIIYLIDKDIIENKSSLQQLFLKSLMEVQNIVKTRKTNTSLKSRILAFVLLMPKYIGWTIPELLLFSLKKKKYEFIKNLKGDF